MATQTFERWRTGMISALAYLLTLGAICFALDIPQMLGMALFTEQYLAFVLGITLALAFLTQPRLKGPLAILDLAAPLAALICGGYVAVFYPTLVNELVYKPLDGLIISLIIVVLTMEATRRVAGTGLAVIVALFVAYGLLGHFIPGALAGRPIQLDRLAIYLAMDSNAIQGLPLIVGSVTVIGFILMGQMLTVCGGGDFFNDLALALVGRRRGGAAKIAVVSSFLFGSVSGSAVANVASTGVVTIPMMKKAGYPPHAAGAVEALASTGGQLAPPIMGAAAFLMAEFLQISYATVVLAAIIPTFLYYFAIYMWVDSEATVTPLTIPEDVHLPKAREVLKQGWHFLVPFVILIGTLFFLNWSPEMAALAGTVSLGVLAIFIGYRGQRLSLKGAVEVIGSTGIAVIEILVICAAAGIVIGVLNLSGLAFNLTLQLVSLADGSLWVLLITAALVSIVLGMGMPTVGVYVLLASLIGPALVQAGVNPVAGHLFLLYFGMLSMITPPVALASFTAATIAKADPWQTGWRAANMGWIAYLIPFVFVLEPALIWQGSLIDGAWHGLGAAAGVAFTTIAFTGCWHRRLLAWERGAFAFAGMLTVLPVHLWIGVPFLGNAVGIAIGAAVMWNLYRTKSAIV